MLWQWFESWCRVMATYVGNATGNVNFPWQGWSVVGDGATGYMTGGAASAGSISYYFDTSVGFPANSIITDIQTDSAISFYGDNGIGTDSSWQADGYSTTNIGSGTMGYDAANQTIFSAPFQSGLSITTGGVIHVLYLYFVNQETFYTTNYGITGINNIQFTITYKPPAKSVFFGINF
jgi:hypothetical protein